MKYNELDGEVKEIFEWFYGKFTEGIRDAIEDGYDREALAEFLMEKADEELEELKWDQEDDEEYETPELD